MKVALGGKTARPTAEKFQQMQRLLLHPPGAACGFTLVDAIDGEGDKANEDVPDGDVEHVAKVKNARLKPVQIGTWGAGVLATVD